LPSARAPQVCFPLVGPILIQSLKDKVLAISMSFATREDYTMGQHWYFTFNLGSFLKKRASISIHPSIYICIYHICMTYISSIAAVQLHFLG
jgi:hypothetical protein